MDMWRAMLSSKNKKRTGQFFFAGSFRKSSYLLMEHAPALECFLLGGGSH
jgi:hypothetical protein